jgi:hypothetical protein
LVERQEKDQTTHRWNMKKKWPPNRRLKLIRSAVLKIQAGEAISLHAESINFLASMDEAFLEKNKHNFEEYETPNPVL